jgi:hypothetical protein
MCKHDWIVLERTILPSAYEQMNKPKLANGLKGDITPFFQKKIIIILSCNRCGKLHKTVESNPG